MIRVAICDDDAEIIEYLQKYLTEKESRLHGAKLDIAVFRSGEDFLCAVERGELFQIILMDIQMGAMSGIDAGQAIRALPNGDDVIMIYISSHNSYFEELVKLGSFRFIRKPIDGKELDEVFDRALGQAVKHRKASTSPRLFQFKIGAEPYSFKTDEIAYLKSIKRTITLFVWDRDNNAISITYKFYSTIDSAMEQLAGGEFVRCERSHIVNLGVVRRMENDSFILVDDGGTRVPIGKVYKAEAKRAYFKYLEGAL